MDFVGGLWGDPVGDACGGLVGELWGGLVGAVYMDLVGGAVCADVDLVGVYVFGYSWGRVDLTGY